MIKFQRKNIETKRLLLKPYEHKFYTDVFQLIQKNKTRLLHSFPKLLKATETVADTKEYVQQKVFDWNKNKAYAFTLFYKESNCLIGHFNIKDIYWKKRECELSYFIDTEFEKTGLMSEAMNTILAVCFNEIKLTRVIVRIVTSNTASVKVAEKSGFKYEGAFYQDYTTYDNKIVDTYRYGISKDEFEKNNKL